jgi:two-component system alkaline phosphatase synthesis response regulator PhoP
MESSKFTILVVDDEELLRKFIVTFLSQLGYSSVTAIDGVDALEKMKGNKIDAVITDIKMPRMDGIILTKEISAQYPGVPVMVMTAFDEEYSAGTAISLGAREFIKKPFSPDEFAIRLTKMIGDSETMKRVKNGKASDQAFQEIRNGSETPVRMKDETETDGGIEKFVDDLIKPLKKS